MADRRREHGGVLVRLLVVVALLGLVAYVADIGLRRWAEQEAALQITEALGAPATVRLPGRLAGLRLLGGRARIAEITARDVPLEGVGREVVVDRLDVVARDVELDVATLAGGGVPEVGSARFEARISSTAVAALLEAPLDVAALELDDDRVVLRVGPARFEAGVRVVDDGTVELTPTGRALRPLGARLVVDLRDQPGAPHVEEVDVDPDALVVRGHLADPSSVVAAAAGR